MIVVQQITCYTGTLGLPVAPDSHGAMVDVVAAESHVDGGVKLDARNLRSSKLLHIVDVVDVIVLDSAEDASHPSHYAGLLTVMDVAATNYMMAYILLEPPVILASANRVALHLGWTLDVLIREEMLVIRIQILAKGYSTAFAVRYLAILYDPAL